MKFSGADNLSPFGAGGLNAYAYCNGDPLNLSDPSGHAAPWQPLLAMLFGVVSVGAGTMAAFSEGEQRNVLIGVAAITGVMSVGLAGSTLLKGGRTAPAAGSGQRAAGAGKTAPAAGGKSASGKGVKGGKGDDGSEARAISDGIDQYQELRPRLTPEGYAQLGLDRVGGGQPILVKSNVAVPNPVPMGNRNTQLSGISRQTSNIRS
ncbi:hypothetical protein V0R50_09130 [Pseudomonas sp. 148P]|uniref:RHS repeat-associated core domain-containing protein n=1 Tax=Pseudomonas ulcerans TaxID=3115852 RepID=A0ABU7HPC4_9PSED|nr:MULTISPECIES: hypothetical protein [unclassified Pseudomonas]MEE1920603.1 hypothetical protein [Pseudomonas sp. 147P]MEE1933385.1 hypothetical protein [Pseudomonas sp. 148P]